MATKRDIVIKIMNANPTEPMDVVVKLIAEAGFPDRKARSYYLWAIRKGRASGVGSTGTVRTRTPGATAKAAKAAKAPSAKATKTKMVKVPAPRVAGDKEKEGINKNMTVEEINDIKAKNLARMKAVAAKYAKGQVADPIRFGRDHTDAEAKAEVEKLEHELDSFKAPAFLKLSDVKALV